jgi:hypothetical protein
VIVTGSDLNRMYLTGSTPRVITVACACGGTIRGNRFEPAVYVAAHNRSNRHRAWREARQLLDESGAGVQ